MKLSDFTTIRNARLLEIIDTAKYNTLLDYANHLSFCYPRYMLNPESLVILIQLFERTLNGIYGLIVLPNDELLVIPAKKGR